MWVHLTFWYFFDSAIFLFQDKDLFFLEVALTFLPPYLSWMTAEGLKLSGIVAILFCGISKRSLNDILFKNNLCCLTVFLWRTVMAHYTLNNLSVEARDFTKKFYKVLAFLSESFVFIYLGMATFLFPQVIPLRHPALDPV